MPAQGYSNPFSLFGGGAKNTPNTFAHGFDFENFDLSSHDDSAVSSDYGGLGGVVNSMDQRDPLLFSAVGKQATKGPRYGTITSPGIPHIEEKSDGEIGAADDDISLGEIRVPGSKK